MIWNSIKYRLKNVFFFSIWFLPLIGALCLAGIAQGAFGEYLFWYAVGAAIGMPIWVAFDVWKYSRASR